MHIDPIPFAGNGLYDVAGVLADDPADICNALDKAFVGNRNIRPNLVENRGLGHSPVGGFQKADQDIFGLVAQLRRPSVFVGERSCVRIVSDVTKIENTEFHKISSQFQDKGALSLPTSL